MSKFKVEKNCQTCEFNFNGICAGGDEKHKKYGHTIYDPTDSCNGWNESLEYFSEIEKNKPWYIEKPYRKGNANGKDAIELLEMDYRGEPIEVNIIELVERVYGLRTFELAEILNVTPGVIGNARYKGVPEKRKTEFSFVLKIPRHFFERVTTCDFQVIEKCHQEFMKEWKEDLPTIKRIAKRKEDNMFGIIEREEESL